MTITIPDLTTLPLWVLVTGTITLWYVLVAGLCRLLLLTDVFHDPGLSDDLNRKWESQNALVVWAFSPLVIPGVIVAPFVWVGVWAVSRGLVPPPWRCITPPKRNTLWRGV